MGHITGLKCKECGRAWPKEAIAACAECWGPLEAVYDMDAVRRTLTREGIAGRARDLWRYAELLPLDGEPTVGRGTGFTPLLAAPRLGAALGIRDLWVKYDAACHPTLSFKDRLVAVALSKAREFGLHTVGCASTGNLANAVAAGAASAGPRAGGVRPEGRGAANRARSPGARGAGVGGGGHYRPGDR